MSICLKTPSTGKGSEPTTTLSSLTHQLPPSICGRHKGIKEILAVVEENRKNLIACNEPRTSPNAYGVNSAVLVDR